MPNANILTVRVTIDKQPVENAQVEIKSGTIRLIGGITGADGKYLLRDVVAGTPYEISATVFGQTSSTHLAWQPDASMAEIDFPITGNKIELLDEAGKPLTIATSGSVVGVRADTQFSSLKHTWLTPGIVSGSPGSPSHEAIWDTSGLSGNQELRVRISDPATGVSLTLMRPIFLAPQASQRVQVGYEGSEAVPVRLTRSVPGATDDQALWVAIRNRTKAIAFSGSGYQDFINQVFYVGGQSQIDARNKVINNSEYGRVFEEQLDDLGSVIHGVGAYELLKTATQAFLLMQCGLIIEERDGFTNELLYRPSEEASRLGAAVPIDVIQQRLTNYLGGANLPLPYLRRIANVTLSSLQRRDAPLCDDFVNARLNKPCMMELIWCFWVEQSMLVQSINAISMRFQNRRSMIENDPLAHLELSPLRSLNNLLWGYIQGEPNRLSVLRRAHEYKNEYDLDLYGEAMGNLRTANSRSKFLEAFHNLLYLLSQYFIKSDDTTVVADAFPVFNALREVHLELATGANNQFGDMPWTARSEMLIQQWLMSRGEMREYLQSRPMVPYKERWMAPVDTLKKMMGWTDVSASTFNDLAVYGEQLLLSIRYGAWVNENDPAQAANWAIYWRPEVQGYMHAYRAATGVDLTAPANDSYQAQLRVMQPSVLLRQRLSTSANAPMPILASPEQGALPSPAQGFRERRAARQS